MTLMRELRKLIDWWLVSWIASWFVMIFGDRNNYGFLLTRKADDLTSKCDALFGQIFEVEVLYVFFFVVIIVVVAKSSITQQLAMSSQLTLTISLIFTLHGIFRLLLPPN